MEGPIRARQLGELRTLAQENQNARLTFLDSISRAAIDTQAKLSRAAGTLRQTGAAIESETRDLVGQLTRNYTDNYSLVQARLQREAAEARAAQARLDEAVALKYHHEYRRFYELTPEEQALPIGLFTAIAEQRTSIEEHVAIVKKAQEHSRDGFGNALAWVRADEPEMRTRLQSFSTYRSGLRRIRESIIASLEQNPGRAMEYFAVFSRFNSILEMQVTFFASGGFARYSRNLTIPVFGGHPDITELRLDTALISAVIATSGAGRQGEADRHCPRLLK